MSDIQKLYIEGRCEVNAPRFIATDGHEYVATHYLCEKDAIGWRPLGDHEPAHFPRLLGAFDPTVEESTDEDSGWRCGPCPSDAVFVVRRPGGQTAEVAS